MSPTWLKLHKPETWFWGGLALLMAVRMVIGALNELSQDEAYYYLWTERLDWSYYSKGPGVALAIKFSTALFGKTALGIRFLSSVLGLGSCFLLYQLGKELVGRPAAMWTIVMLNLTPIFNVGSILLTIDPLMIFFWIAAMFTSWKALRDPQNELRWWLLTGLAIGLGMICKYTILLQVLSLVLILAMTPERRVQFKRPGFYAMLGMIALCALPVLVWNAKHDWITLTHLKDHTASAPPLEGKSGFLFAITQAIGTFLPFYGGHFLVYSPLFFFGLLWACVIAVARFRRSEEDFFLAAFSLPIVFLYFILAFKADGELNWTAPGFIGLGLILTRHWLADIPRAAFGIWGSVARWVFLTPVEIASRCPKAKPGITIAALVIAGTLSFLLTNPDLLRVAGISWPYQNDPYLRLRGWKTFAEVLDGEAIAIEKQTGQKPFLIANRYQTAAAPAFYFKSESHVFRATPKDPLIHLLEPAKKGAIRNQFSFWPSYFDRTHSPDGNPENPYLHRAALFIADEPPERKNPPEEITKAFAQYEPVAWIRVMRRGQVLRTWKIFACYDYQMLHPLASGSGE